ncbi:MAG: hypothetical protein JWP01_1023 [Myxococcales bacterium]|nr:hypothetical protein [Myxococcales bacterium]
MRGVVLVVLAVLGACSSGPSQPRSPLVGRGAPAVAPSPAPSIRWVDNGFEPAGLPAVATDGSIVVSADIAGDGARGNPNLRIVVRDRRDAEQRSLLVLGPDEVDRMFDTQGAVPELTDRIAEGNRLLADLHTRHALIPLEALTIDRVRMAHGAEQELPPAERRRATGEHLVIDWSAGTLSVTNDDRQVLASPVPAAWSPPDRPTCSSCPQACHHEPFFASAWADVARSVALVTITYTGTDTCWEPDAELYVISW